MVKTWLRPKLDRIDVASLTRGGRNGYHGGNGRHGGNGHHSSNNGRDNHFGDGDGDDDDHHGPHS